MYHDLSIQQDTLVYYNIVKLLHFFFRYSVFNFEIIFALL